MRNLKLCSLGIQGTAGWSQPNLPFATKKTRGRFFKTRNRAFPTGLQKEVWYRNVIVLQSRVTAQVVTGSVLEATCEVRQIKALSNTFLQRARSLKAEK